jgi:two-component system sensor histidine kinase KdpD
MSENRAASFLQMIRRSERGRLKVYLGYGPGVGKTYQMLLEGRRLKEEGIDVVVGVVETHGRADTAKLLEGLETVPRKRQEYRGIAIEEMDLDALLARHPQVALVDELAHTNAPGSRSSKRFQDVQELLAAGIHVITTLNVQHLESLYNTVERLIGVKVRERLPDSVLAEADQIVDVDLAPEDLEKRLRAGKIYPKDRIASAVENFFKLSNLEQLRELTLREIASQIDLKRREVKKESEENAPDQVMVCLSSRGPNSARLLRFASRLAGRLNRNWYAVYVQTPSEEPTAIDAATQRMLGDTLTLANQLGAMVFTFKGQDIVDTIIQFAKEYRVGHIVMGRPGRLPWWRRILGQRGVAERLIRQSEGFTVVIVDAQAEERLGSDLSPGQPAPSEKAARQAAKKMALGDLLAQDRIVIWNQPVGREAVLEDLVGALARANPGVHREDALLRLEERERQGSTFLNEGIALPHARLDGLESPQTALGLTRQGVSDAPAGMPVEVVLLVLTPAGDPDSGVRILGAAARALQKRELRQRLRQAGTPGEALEAIRTMESPGPAPPSPTPTPTSPAPAG